MAPVWPMGCVLALWPAIRLHKYVDDIRIQMSGPAAGVAAAVPNAVAFLAERLEEDGTPVSRGECDHAGGKSVRP
eukprot:11192608-Lingulodinium_polyedra.AAC.1